MAYIANINLLSKRNNLIFKFVFLILSLYMLTGCPWHRHWLYIESENTLNSNLLIRPQIIESKSFKDISAKVNTVAVKAPDSCYGQSSKSSNKNIKYQKDVVRSNCGVEIGIIEKKLIEKDYNVVSWEMLESMAKSNNKSYLECAKELNVDVLFSVNLLEKIGASDSDDPIKRSYFKSDVNGIKGAPWALGEDHKKIIRSILYDFETDLYWASFGASIDITAIDVKTGKSIWFYKASFYDMENQETKITSLFAQRNRRWGIYKLNDKPVQRRTSSNTELDRKEKTNLDIYYQKYLTEAISTFIESFKFGK